MAGFSIVESMVGFLLLGITMTALFGGFSFGFKTIKLSQEEVRADQILVQKLEALRTYYWSNIANPYIPLNFTNNYSSTNGVTYIGQMTVTPFVPSATPESYAPTLRQVTATLSWDSGGITRTRTMTTLVSTNGLMYYKPGS